MNKYCSIIKSNLHNNDRLRQIVKINGQFVTMLKAKVEGNFYCPTMMFGGAGTLDQEIIRFNDIIKNIYDKFEGIGAFNQFSDPASYTKDKNDKELIKLIQSLNSTKTLLNDKTVQELLTQLSTIKNITQEYTKEIPTKFNFLNMTDRSKSSKIIFDYVKKTKDDDPTIIPEELPEDDKLQYETYEYQDYSVGSIEEKGEDHNYIKENLYYGNPLTTQIISEKFKFDDVSKIDFFRLINSDVNFRQKVIDGLSSSQFESATLIFPSFNHASEAEQAEFILIKIDNSTFFTTFMNYHNDKFIGVVADTIIGFNINNVDENEGYAFCVAYADKNIDDHSNILTFMRSKKVSKDAKHNLLYHVSSYMLNRYHKLSSDFPLDGLWLSTYALGTSRFHFTVRRDPEYYNTIRDGNGATTQWLFTNGYCRDSKCNKRLYKK
jgi:hypothetical protein